MPDSHRLLRLDHLLSRYGYCSRREAKDWLNEGRVKLDGEIVSDASQRVDPRQILVDGGAIDCPNGLFAMFHKPAGYTCSHDEHERPTIYDLLPERWNRRNPPVESVGRLDRDTTGLLLLTDMGAVVHRLTSPRHKVPKLYLIEVNTDLKPEWIPLFASGALVLDKEEHPCLPARLEFIGTRSARLELIEGKYHQVKRMFGSQGATVTRLHRVCFGAYDLGDLSPGQWRFVKPPDLSSPDSVASPSSAR